MVVVPALSESEERHPEVVCRVVARLEPARAPEMRRGVHEPRRMQTERRTQEGGPEDVGDASKYEEPDADDHLRHPVPGRQPDIKPIAAEIRRIAGQALRVVVQPLAGHDPSHVRPERSLAWRVRIAFAVRLLMMDTVCRDPEDRPALEGERSADRQDILDPLASLVAA